MLFGVYKYAYGSRLVEAMRNDHKLLHSYLGDEMFDAMGARLCRGQSVAASEPALVFARRCRIS